MHGFVGSDRRRDPERVASVLRRLDADVVALQEVDEHLDDGAEAWEALGRDLGLHAIPGPTFARTDGRYGNLLLTRLPVTRVEKLDLSHAGQEPRGAIDATLEADGSRIRILVTHLGLSRRERARQASRLCDALDARDGDCELVMLLGDLNEWRPLSRTGLAPLLARFSHRARPRTFPARAPLLPLDRVLVDRADARVALRVVRSAAVRAASDHLLVRAHIELDRPIPA